MRSFADPVAIMTSASRLLAEHLGVSHAIFSEFEGEGAARIAQIRGQYTADGEPAPNPIPDDAFVGGEIARLLSSGGEPVVEDSAREERFGASVREVWLAAGLRSMVAVGLVKDGREVARFGMHHSSPCAWASAEVGLVREVAERTWAAVERARAQTALDVSERFSRAVVEGMPQLVWRAIDGGRWTWASPQWTHFTGQTEADSHGDGWLDPVHPEDRERVKGVWAGAVERGEFHADYRLHEAATDRYRWFQSRATPVCDAAGEIIEWFGTSTDVDDLRRLQEDQEVLVAELQHRTRNLMGVVRSMADTTARSSTDFADFRVRYRDRLNALARVQGLLSRLNDHDRVTFDELVATELAAMDGGAEKVVVRGPKGVRLRSSTVQTLAMALHELATNAQKYGALGQADARLEITWSMEEGSEPLLHIDWRESGVVMPKPGGESTGTGQGRSLIQDALSYQLQAKTTYALGPDGVHCTMIIPVSESTISPEAINA